MYGGRGPSPLKHPMFLQSCTTAVLDLFFSIRTEVPAEGAGGAFFDLTSQTWLPLKKEKKKMNLKRDAKISNKNIFLFAKGVHTVH